jgi:hypothetical protein
LFMVIYHGLNYLGYQSVPHDYLSFVPPSFIMIAGYIITHVYVSKYGLTSQSLPARLIRRSCKLLLLFTFLNVGALLLFSSKLGGGALNLDRFIKNGFEIYIAGGSRWAAFEVLLPIGYLLFLAIPVLKFQSLFPYAICGVSMMVAAVCLVMDYYGYSVYNLYLISAGAVGMAIGLMPGPIMNAASYSWIALLSAYLLYWCCFHIFGDIYIVQMFATLICLFIIYAVGTRIELQSWLPRQSLLLGRYSLLSYIIQILYLQIFIRSPFYRIFDLPGIVLIVIATMILTWGTILIVDYARTKNESFDGAYKFIFA